MVAANKEASERFTVATMINRYRISVLQMTTDMFHW
jgi:hypothetical protein